VQISCVCVCECARATMWLVDFISIVDFIKFTRAQAQMRQPKDVG